MKKFFYLVLFSLAFVQPSANASDLQQVATDDLQAAIDIAKADNDAPALECWTSIQVALPTLGKPLPQVKGVASAIQAKRSLKGRLDAGLPESVVRGCAVLYTQERKGAAEDLMKFIGVLR